MYSAGIVLEWLVLAFVVFGVQRFGAPISAIIGPPWRNVRDIGRDILIALLFMLISSTVLFALARLFPGQPNLQPLLPRGGAEMALWTALSLSAGVCEEAIFRGYLQGQLTSLRSGAPAAILISGVIFGIAHIYQGPRQVAFIAVYGMMFGMLAHIRGSVRPGMIAHFLNDALIGLAAGIAAQHAP